METKKIDKELKDDDLKKVDGGFKVDIDSEKAEENSFIKTIIDFLFGNKS